MQAWAENFQIAKESEISGADKPFISKSPDSDVVPGRDPDLNS